MKKMVRLISIFTTLVLVMTTLGACGASTTTTTTAAGTTAGAKKQIGYFKAAADDYYKAGWDVFKALADKEGWDVQEVVGDGTDAKMLSAVEDFISQKKDAIVCVQTTAAVGGEAAKKAKEAGIPFYSLTHQPQVTKGFEPTGAVCYDWQ